MSEEIIKYLKNSIDEKGNYCYSLPIETTKAIIKEIERLNNIINEAKEECKSVIEDSEHTTVSEFNINGLMKIMLNILNKGE
jgi:hypothetical protein